MFSFRSSIAMRIVIFPYILALAATLIKSGKSTSIGESRMEDITERLQALYSCKGFCLFNELQISAKPLKSECESVPFVIEVERNCSYLDPDPFPDPGLSNPFYSATLCVSGPSTALPLSSVANDDGVIDIGINLDILDSYYFGVKISSIRQSHMSGCPILDIWLYNYQTECVAPMTRQDNILVLLDECIEPHQGQTLPDEYLITAQVLHIKDFSDATMQPPYSQWAGLLILCQDPECAEEGVYTPGLTNDLPPLMPIVILPLLDDPSDLGPVMEGDPIDKIFPICQ